MAHAFGKMNLKSVLMTLAALFGNDKTMKSRDSIPSNPSIYTEDHHRQLAALFDGREKPLKSRDAKPKQLFISPDEKQQIPQAYIPPNPVKYPEDHCRNFNEDEEFDFVVIGAGPAGATVARRLAEDPKVRVLLMEAGGNPPPQSDIPSLFEKVKYEEKWHFTNCVNSEGGSKCSYGLGKGLGGSTMTNTMNYARGNRKDFDDWAKNGCTGWSYKDVLPYFIKSENYIQFPLLSTVEVKKSKDPNLADKKYHGTKGPMYNSGFKEDPSTSAIRDALIQAQVENGIEYNPDINGANQMGVTNMGGMVDPLGYRSSAAKAFLLYIPDNLKVCKYATALKIDLEGKSAAGIEFRYNGTGEVKNYRVKAKREYIISAGPFNSAPLLERSGIGRKEVLEKAGVGLKHELVGVGENFQNHFSSKLLFKANFQSQAAPNPLSTPMRYFASYINTTDPKSGVPDIELVGSVHTTPGFVDKFASLSEVGNKELKDVLSGGLNIIEYGAIHLRHPNPGSIHITQPEEDPSVSPRIVNNKLLTELDKERVTKALHTVRKFMASDVLKPFNVEPIVIDDCKQHKFNSDEEIICQWQILTGSLYHACGMTAMGAKDDPNSVVDPELRLIGTDNIRVVDTGILPSITRGHLTPAAVLIGDKAADMIKKFWR